MKELWEKIMSFMTGEAFSIANFPILWWYVIVAAVVVVVLLLVITIAVASSKKKKKKKAKKALEDAKINEDSAKLDKKDESTNGKEDKAFKEISPDWQPTLDPNDRPQQATAEANQVVDNKVEETEAEVKEEVAPAPKQVERVEYVQPVKQAPVQKVYQPVYVQPAPAQNVRQVPVYMQQAQATEQPAKPVQQVQYVPVEPVEKAVQSTPPVQPVEQPVEQVRYVPVQQTETVEQPVTYSTNTYIATAEEEAVATTTPRALPKKKTKTTKKTAQEIADDITEKTGENPRLKYANGDKPAVIGKDKLPKKSSAKAKKEQEAKANDNLNDELPLITTDPEVESFGKFVIVKNDDNSARPYHFRLLANNGQILFESEPYKAKPRTTSIIAFKKCANIENFEIDEDKANNWRYKLYNNSHSLIGVGESYSTKQGCENSVQSVVKFAESARYLEDQTEEESK